MDARVLTTLTLRMIRHAGLLLLSVFFASSVAHAQEGVQINTESGVPVTHDLLVAPTRRVVTLQPGESKTVDVELINRHGRDVTVDLSTEDFAADPLNDGLPTFFTDNNAGPFPARAWIRPETNVLTLQHGQRAFVRVTLTAPQDADPGDHQAALIVTPRVSDTNQPGFSIVSRVASLFILHVPGDIVEDGDVVSVHVERSMNWWLPVRLHVGFRNDGTVFMMPEGTVQIRNIFGITVDELPLKDWIVLRGSRRSKDFAWEPTFALGRYTATANFKAFGDGRQLSAVSAGFWVFPLLPVLTVLLAIFVVSFFVQYFFSRFEFKRKG